MAKDPLIRVPIAELDEQTRQRFFKRLESHYARVLVEGRWVAFTFGGGKDDEKQLDRRARDLINEAVMQVLRGRRTWNPDVDFVVFVKLTMKSIASNEWKKARRNESMHDEAEGDDGNRAPKRQFAEEDDPLQLALDEQAAEARVYELLEAAEGDDVLTRVVDAYLQDGCEQPRHVATRLGMSVKDVYQAQRKLERRVTSMRKKVNT